MAVVYESGGAEYGPWGLDKMKQIEAEAKYVGSSRAATCQTLVTERLEIFPLFLLEDLLVVEYGESTISNHRENIRNGIELEMMLPPVRKT